MSPRQTRRGTIRQTHSTDINQQDTNAMVDHITPKTKQYKTRRQTRMKKSAGNEDEQEEKLSTSPKEKNGGRSKKNKKGHNKSDNTSSNSDDNTLKYGLPECDQDLKSRPKLPNKIDTKNDLLKPATQKLDVTFTPELPSLKQTNSDNIYTPTVTPKSSPIVVTLTPHRTTKTPRKSPDNLASPRTHSKAPKKLSKTPRKLSISANSPVLSDKSGVPNLDDESNASDRGMSSNISLDTATTDVSPGSKKKKKVVSLKSSHAVRRFSKSPKIVLRSPKTKARKSKSPKTAHGIVKASPKKGSSRQKRGSPLSSPKSELTHITTAITNGDSVMLSKLTPAQMVAFNNKPRIVLEKLTLPNEEITKLSSDDKSPDQVIKTPVTQILAYGAESPKRVRSTAKKRSSIFESETPLRPIPSPKADGSEEHIGKESLNITNTTLIQLPNMESEPILSSTPRDKIRRLLNLTDSPQLEKSPGMKRSSPTKRKSKKESYPRMSKAGINDTDQYIRIEDISQPLVDLSCDRLPENLDANGTYEIRQGNTSGAGNKTNDVDNDTYEVLEPKTPNIRQKSKKRSTTDANLSDDHDHPKRVCKVRFASPDAQAADSVKKFTTVMTKTKPGTPRKEVRNTSTPNTQSRRRSRSTTDVSEGKRMSGTTQGKQRSMSSSRINIKLQNNKKVQETPGNKSMNRSNCVSTEKKGSKTPLTRRVPNFAQIHQKKFAEMESILDAKNRIQKRHLALTSAQTLSKPLSDHKIDDLPTTTRNGVYNRFGFKIKKDNAKDIVLKKQPVQRMKTKQEENRAFIKGVRMNRRFELQMKSRNVKL